RRAARGFVPSRTQRFSDRMTPTIGRDTPSELAWTGRTVYRRVSPMSDAEVTNAFARAGAARWVTVSARIRAPRASDRARDLARGARPRTTPRTSTPGP